MLRFFVMLLVVSVQLPLVAADQPNILWLTAEDIGPHLGCYGDTYATTPHLDKLASTGLRYVNAWSNAPVCAPARTTIISGMYPPATGSEHMRSMATLPKDFLMYPNYMRKAGYFCVNPGKEDYNLNKTGNVWDVADKKNLFAQLKEHQPFMAVLNQTNTHESKIRSKPHTPVHDPAGVRIPAYHPDTPEVRKDWAQYYDNITEMDEWVQQQLDDLEKQGLADNTIIMFYGDHGSGMPRNKRWPYNSGLSVPFLLYVPPKLKDLAPKEYVTGGTSERLIGFVDLAQTVISLAGQEPPAHMQGNPFMGKFETPEPKYAFGFRGRMDERYDLVRSVRNRRYIYIRNYMPHKIYGQHIDYMFQTTTTRVWKELYDTDKLNEAQSVFWKTKTHEELYDLETDYDEINNLADSQEHLEVLNELRLAHEEWVFRVKDVGFLPESDLHNQGMPPYEYGHSEKYNLKEIYRVANAAASLKMEQVPFLMEMLEDQDSTVRYWAALGLLMREQPGVAASEETLKRIAKGDASSNVRVIASEALGRYGDDASLKIALNSLIECANAKEKGQFVAMLALNAIDTLGEKASPLQDDIAKLPTKGDWATERVGDYVPRLVEELLKH